MEIITNALDFYLERETAVAIGKFDGLHIGHRRLLEEILEKKRQGLAPCVFTFDPAPAVLFGHSDGMELTTREEKRLLLERMGVELLIEFPLTAETAAISPERFVTEILAERMKVQFLAAGRDLSFGAGGEGNAALLQGMGAELGFSVKIIEKVCLEEREVSSTYVRDRVEAGDMQLAERLLGMPYMIAGEVVAGKQLGRTIGFPTVNLLPERTKLLPPNGVYFSRVRCRDKSYRAITNVGCRPTVTDERTVGVESYLYDFGEDAYGQQIEVYLEEFYRPEKRFDGVEALKRQLEKDIAAGRGYRVTG